MINIIGLGYIGLPTALMFAQNKDNEVVGTDLNSGIVDSLSSNKLTFEEKGLDDLFNSAVANGIKFSTDYKKADVYIISVPTPYIKSSKKLDPAFVIGAVNNILEVCGKGAIIVIESTISPGTIDKYIRPVIEDNGLKIGEDVHIAHAPERIIPGNMVYELNHNARTIGADSEQIANQLRDLYSGFCKGEISITDIKSAEMSKVVENTYRDINIAFANELAKICEEADMDVYEIIKLANKHPRVNILQPGPGVGGHCISVDPWFLVGDYPETAQIIKQARNINDSMPEYVLHRIEKIMKENSIEDFSKVGLYGITYKEDVDDTRESPTLQLFNIINEKYNDSYKKIRAYDPFIKGQVVDSQDFDFKEFLTKSELIVIMVAHTQIKNSIKDLDNKVIFDTRNCCNIKDVYKL